MTGFGFQNRFNLGLSRVSGQGGTPLTFRAPVFSEEFSYPDGTRLVAGDPNTNYGQGSTNPGNLGWTAITTGVADTKRYNPIVHGGQLVLRSVANSGDFTNPGKYLLTPPTNNSISGNQTIVFEHTNATGRAQVCLLATNEANRLNVFVNKTNDMGVRTNIGGTDTGILGVAGFNSKLRMGGVNGSFRLFTDPVERITMVVFNGKVYPRRGPGFPIGPAAGTAFTDPGGTLIGVNTLNNQFAWVGKMEAISSQTRLDINPTHITWRPKRRTSAAQPINVGWADHTFTGTYEGVAPAKLQYALAAQGTGVIVSDWATIPDADVTIGGGTFTAIIRNIPAGINGRNGVCPGFRVVDAANVVDPYTAIFSNREVYTSLNIGTIGQSNAAYYNNSVSGTKNPRTDGLGKYTKADPPSLVAGSASMNPDFWEDTVGYQGGTATFELADALAAKYNIPVTVETLAIPARGANALGPGGGDWAYIQTHHAHAGGAYDILLLSQGENEFAGAASWTNQWVNTNFPAYRDPAMHGQPAGTVIPIFHAMTGRFTGAPGAYTDANAHSLRVQQEALSGLVSDCFFAHTYTGIKMTDTFHYSNVRGEGNSEAIRRARLTVMKWLDGTGYDGLGPNASSVSRTAGVLTVSFNLNGATSLTARNGTDQSLSSSATALTAWQVSVDDFATLLTITSVELVGNQVIITLASDPGGPVKVRWHYGLNPDISSTVAGAYADGTFICMRPLVNPLTST